MLGIYCKKYFSLNEAPGAQIDIFLDNESQWLRAERELFIYSFKENVVSNVTDLADDSFEGKSTFLKVILSDTPSC